MSNEELMLAVPENFESLKYWE